MWKPLALLHNKTHCARYRRSILPSWLAASWALLYLPLAMLCSCMDTAQHKGSCDTTLHKGFSCIISSGCACRHCCSNKLHTGIYGCWPCLKVKFCRCDSFALALSYSVFPFLAAAPSVTALPEHVLHEVEGKVPILLKLRFMEPAQICMIQHRKPAIDTWPISLPDDLTFLARSVMCTCTSMLDVQKNFLCRWQ